MLLPRHTRVSLVRSKAYLHKFLPGQETRHPELWRFPLAFPVRKRLRKTEASHWYYKQLGFLLLSFSSPLAICHEIHS